MTESTHAEHASHHDHGGQGRLGTSVHATAHCLIGCAIGEFAGLAIGVQLGLGIWTTMGLATVLAFIVGLNLAALPLIRGQGMDYAAALRTIWLGEVVSIAVMELAMNATDYWLGGVAAQSLAEPVFWIGFAAAIPAGFIAALPINYWLIGRSLKHCH